MKEDTKRAKLAALLGLEEHLPTEPTPDQAIEQQTASREAEATAAYIAQPQRFIRKKCKECEAEFASDRGNVAYCNDNCRKNWLARIGIIWDPKKPPSQRWDFVVVTNDNGETTSVGSTREPLTVPPPALVVADLAVEVLAAQSQESQNTAVNETVFEIASPVSLVPVESGQSQGPIVFDL